MKTRYQTKKAEEEVGASRKRKIQEERAKILFVRKGNVIRKNDMIVNVSLNKIKLDSEAPEGTLEELKQEEELVEDSQIEGVNIVVEGPLGGGIEGGDNGAPSSATEQDPITASASTQTEIPVESEESEVAKLRALLREKEEENKVLRDKISQAGEDDSARGEIASDSDEPDIEVLKEVRHGTAVSGEIKMLIGELCLKRENLKELLRERDAELEKTKTQLRAKMKELEEMRQLLGRRNAEIGKLMEQLHGLQNRATVFGRETAGAEQMEET